MGWNIVILGATGAVGRVMRECLEKSPIEVASLRLLATPTSAGTRLSFRGRELTVEPVSVPGFADCDVALFSAGAGTSAEWAGPARDAGAWVIDNSSRFRMDPDVPLIVPEVNGAQIPKQPCIIANPNCSTIQLVVALAPLHRRFGLGRVVVTTYQSVSGAGNKGIASLQREIGDWEAEVAAGTGWEGPPQGGPGNSIFPHPIAGNVLPQCDVFLEDGYTREEEKMLLETRKILAAPDLRVQPTCVRVPVVAAHSEAVYIETESPTSCEELREILEGSPGIRVLDDPDRNLYPQARLLAGTDPVWVGRLRQDRCQANGFHFWIVADNLRKGAALNAVQIAEEIWNRGGSGR